MFLLMTVVLIRDVKFVFSLIKIRFEISEYYLKFSLCVAV